MSWSGVAKHFRQDSLASAIRLNENPGATPISKTGQSFYLADSLNRAASSGNIDIGFQSILKTLWDVR